MTKWLSDKDVERIATHLTNKRNLTWQEIDGLFAQIKEANRLRAGLEARLARLDVDVEFYEQWGNEINEHAANALKIVGDYIRELLEGEK